MKKIHLLTFLFLALPFFMGKSCNAYDPTDWHIALGGQDLGGAGVIAKPLNKDAFTNTAAFATSGSIGLLNPRRDHTSTLLLDGRVLVVGGEAGGAAVGEAELYDQGSGEFTKATDLNSARMRHTATLLSNGNVIIAGGQDTQLNPLQSIEVYDPNLNTFAILLSTLSVPRYGHSATLFPSDGGIAFIGGFKDNQITPEATEQVDLFKPAGPPGQKITAAESMVDNRAHHAAALIPGPDKIMGTADDRVLITYGIGSIKQAGQVNHVLRSNFAVFDRTQNPGTGSTHNQWKTPQGVNGIARRWCHHALQTLNANFDVLIIAGIGSNTVSNYTDPRCASSPRDDGSSPVAAVEVYRPLETLSDPAPKGAPLITPANTPQMPPPMQPFVGGAGSVITRHPNGVVFLAAGVSLDPGPPCQRIYSNTGYLINVTDADPANWPATRQTGLAFVAVTGAPQSSPASAPGAGNLTIANAFCAMSSIPGADGFGGSTDDSLLICGGQETGPNQIQNADVYTMPDTLP